MHRASRAILGLVVAIAACDSAEPVGEAERRAPASPACDPDDGGLRLPTGFCALVVADDLGRARHLAVGGNGDVFVAIRGEGGGVVALRDSDGDGRADQRERFFDTGGTGIARLGAWLYLATDTAIVRWRLEPGELVPSAPPEPVVEGFPEQRSHPVKPFEIDDAGWLYVNVGAPSNSCQEQDRAQGSPGLDPCPLLDRSAGVWRFRADRLGQRFEDGERFASGIRNGVANDWNPLTRRLYVAQHGRDQLHESWPALYDARDGAELPAEELFEVDAGDDFGWPYCYYDHRVGKKVLAPEYGGDGERVGRCARYEDPLVAFPGHWAPNDLLFYTGELFPERYRGGAFIAFHGSWNRTAPQQGYRVSFVPFDGSAPAGDPETFADGFAGTDAVANPGEAAHRPMGLAQGVDGSLFISDSVRGRLWRVLHRGAR